MNSRANTSPSEVSSQSSADEAGIYTNLKELVELNILAHKLTLPKALNVRQLQTGSHHSRFRGRGMEFAEVRAYQPGDDVRSIDWRVTARRQATHTKLFQEERERPVFIICDQSSSMFFGSRGSFKSVLAARAAALIAWTAHNHNDRIGGVVFSDAENTILKPARSKKDTLRFMQTLVDYNKELGTESSSEYTHAPSSSKPQTSLLANLREALQVIRPGSLVVVISDFIHISPEYDATFAKLAKHNELILLACNDPLEISLPATGVYPIKANNQTLYLNAASTKTQKAFKDWRQAIDHQFEKFRLSFRADLWPLTTDKDLSEQLRMLIGNLQRS